MKKIIVVSGNPRSGTSMMMHMLKAGGVELFHNSTKEPDEHNPDGYYQTTYDIGAWGGWINQVDGKAMKLHSNQLKNLPKQYFGDIEYKVIFMKRNPLASAKSLDKMHGVADTFTDEQVIAAYDATLQEVEALGLNILNINYEDMIADAATCCATINEFLGGSLNISAMVDIPTADKKHF